jgi:hypothetical protein
MDQLFEILKYVLPSVIVFFTAYYLVKEFIEKDQQKRSQEILLGNQKLITPLRLQAYERIVLFLERISPETLAMRVQQPGMTARQLQSAMLTTIRAEFEHNLSQQIYIGPQTWEAVKSAKESIVKLVNASAMRLTENATSFDMSKMMIEMYVSVDQPPVSSTISLLKQEIYEHFGMNIK